MLLPDWLYDIIIWPSPPPHPSGKSLDKNKHIQKSLVDWLDIFLWPVRVPCWWKDAILSIRFYNSCYGKMWDNVAPTTKLNYQILSSTGKKKKVKIPALPSHTLLYRCVIWRQVKGLDYPSFSLWQFHRNTSFNTLSVSPSLTFKLCLDTICTTHTHTRTHTHTHTKAPVTFHHRSFRRPSVNDPMPVSCVFLFLCGCPCLCMF